MTCKSICSIYTFRAEINVNFWINLFITKGAELMNVTVPEPKHWTFSQQKMIKRLVLISRHSWLSPENVTHAGQKIHSKDVKFTYHFFPIW